MKLILFNFDEFFLFYYCPRLSIAAKGGRSFSTVCKWHCCYLKFFVSSFKSKCLDCCYFKFPCTIVSYPQFFLVPPHWHFCSTDWDEMTLFWSVSDLASRFYMNWNTFTFFQSECNIWTQGGEVDAFWYAHRGGYLLLLLRRTSWMEICKLSSLAIYAIELKTVQ